MKKIIHVDMDCFYAAVEVRDRPDLRGKPVVVGGRPDGRGVIATASYEARKFGVKSAMSSARAIKLCPDLIFVQPHFAKYKSDSQKIREIFSRFTDKIQPLSLDEAFLDVTDCEQFENNATAIAKEIRRLIQDELGLTASAGIAPNKFLAKVASEWRKPNGQYTVTPDQVLDFVEALPVSAIFGVGKVTEAKMKKNGLNTCGDIREKTLTELEHLFGSWGARLYDLSRGIDNREVKTSSERKSLSVERTFGESIDGFDKAKPQFEKVYDEFVKRFENSRVKTEEIRSIYVKIKFDDFSQVTREKQWSKSSVPSLEDFNDLFYAGWAGQVLPVRLLGMGVRMKAKSAEKKKGPQLSLF